MLAHNAAVHHAASIASSTASESVTDGFGESADGCPTQADTRCERWTSMTGVIARMPPLSRSQLMIDGAPPAGTSPTNRRSVTLKIAGIAGASMAAARNENVDLSRDSQDSSPATFRAARKAAAAEDMKAGPTINPPRQP